MCDIKPRCFFFQLSKATQSEQAMRDRLSAAEKQLREIEEIGSKSSSSTQSSFKVIFLFFENKNYLKYLAHPQNI